MTQHFAIQATALAFPADGHFDLPQVMCLDFAFCNLQLPTLPIMPNFFSSLCMGALSLANPDNSLFLSAALLSKSTLMTSQGPD